MKGETFSITSKVCTNVQNIMRKISCHLTRNHFLENSFRILLREVSVIPKYDAICFNEAY